MSFTLKLNICTATVPCAYSITQLVVEKIKALQESFNTIAGVEVHLFESDEVEDSSKGATLSINTQEQKIITESCNKSNWEDAVMCVYERLEQKFISIY
jgi:ribosome-associated translation inhibitor RaiA